jgi:hypothetical protein
MKKIELILILTLNMVHQYNLKDNMFEMKKNLNL